MRAALDASSFLTVLFYSTHLAVIRFWRRRGGDARRPGAGGARSPGQAEPVSRSATVRNISASWMRPRLSRNRPVDTRSANAHCQTGSAATRGRSGARRAAPRVVRLGVGGQPLRVDQPERSVAGLEQVERVRVAVHQDARAAGQRGLAFG